MSSAEPTDADLIGLLIDGPADPASQQELARRMARDPALGRRVVAHLRIAEMAHQQAAEERSAAGFLAGWQVRVQAEQDGAVFTGRTMLRLAAAEQARRDGYSELWLRLGATAAAAALMLVLAGGISELNRRGRTWMAGALPNLASVSLHNDRETLLMQREFQGDNR